MNDLQLPNHYHRVSHSVDSNIRGGALAITGIFPPLPDLNNFKSLLIENIN